MALVPKIDPNKIFASNAPTQDKPAAFDNYEKGMDETRKNLGRPTIPQLNYLHQTADQKVLWIHQNGAALPHDPSIEYAEKAVTLKDGELKQLVGGAWVETKTKSLPATAITTASAQNQQAINDFGGAKWYAKSGGYDLGATVKLDNGETVKSTEPANIVNPNVDMNGWVYDASGISVPQRFINSIVITPYQFGGKGIGTDDDTQAVIDAFNFANALKRNGILSHIKHSGATVDFCRGKWNLETISESLLVECDVTHSGAEVLIPPSYAGTVFTIGLTETGTLLSTSNINLPDTNKPTGTTIVPNSRFALISNINASRISFGRSDYFDIAYDFAPIGQATVYCRITFGQVSYANTIIRIVPKTGGWVNANNFYKGNLRLGGDHVAGKYHLYFDGTSNDIIGNNFFGLTLEGGGAEKVGYFKKAYGNNFFGSYIETQSAAKSVSVSGVTITSDGHGYAVNDIVLFAASTLPTGMFDLTKYFVVSATANTFSVSLKKNGTPISFATSGSSVRCIRQGVVVSDGSSTYDNKFINTLYPPSVALGFLNINGALNNGDNSPTLDFKETYKPNDQPLYAGRNTSQIAGLLRPVFAAYPPTVSPVDSPEGWIAALSDRGLIFKDAGGVKSGRIYSSGGRTYSEGAEGTTAYQLAPIVKNESYFNIPSSSSVPANSRLLIDVPVDGATVGDFVSLALNTLFDAGIIIAWSRVRTTGIVQLCLHNVTSTAIDVSAKQLKVLCIKGNV